jgi:Cu+-exporting ATPase
LLSENDLCSYYDIDNNPGIKAKGKFVSSRFAYLEDETIINKLVQFRSDEQVNITFSLPQMHCSSCIYLLENLHRIDRGVIHSQAHFDRKEVFVRFNPSLISLRKLAELLAFIGYEPAISLDDAGPAKKSSFNRSRIIELGVAGFCFSNIMMLSFPEYFSGGEIEQAGLKETFNWIILLLSVPVLFYSARTIFISAWKGLRQGIINIDAPIALASIITFSRSYYEIISATGSGYLDSGTGIIFFMLIGRWFQAKTYDAISFDRQYRSYFPLGVTVLREHKEENIPVTNLQKGESIIIRNEEMIPADAILVEGTANIDYSFVSGENIPVSKKTGELLYAGGKQQGGALLLKVVKEPSQSYITQLWNNDVFGQAKHTKDSFIHPWSRYFTAVLFSIAALAAAFWYFYDPSKIWTVVTAVLIIACPCSLLLSATFTFGNMLRVFGKHKLYLKNASVIESLAAIDHIVLDKTGTITETGKATITFNGENLSAREKDWVRFAASQSSHALSHSLVSFLPANKDTPAPLLQNFAENAGQGILAELEEAQVQLGSASFVEASANHQPINSSCVYVRINDSYKGYYEIANTYRPGIANLARELDKKGYKIHLLSGDNDAERQNLVKLLGEQIPLNFNISPQQKLGYIKQLQENQAKVLMIGDGLNDAGALMQSNCGMAVSDDAARFSPACDAIIDGGSLNKLSKFLGYAKAGRKIVLASFILSILYNVAGISFAVQGILSPLVAAILMPASSISIVLFVSLLTSFIARRKGL